MQAGWTVRLSSVTSVEGDLKSHSAVGTSWWIRRVAMELLMLNMYVTSCLLSLRGQARCTNIHTRHTYFTGSWCRIYLHHVLFSRSGKKFQISKDANPPPLSSFHIVPKFVDQSNNTHVWTGDSESLSTFTLLSLSTLAKSWKETETADKPNVVRERKQHERPKNDQCTSVSSTSTSSTSTSSSVVYVKKEFRQIMQNQSHHTTETVHLIHM